MKQTIENLQTIITENPDFILLGEENLHKIYNQKFVKISYSDFEEAYQYLMFGSIQEGDEESEDFELTERRYI